MKARFVFEFQKGIDPRAGMGIGQIEEWKDRILNTPTYSHGGQELHDYIRSIIRQGPKYAESMAHLLKTIIQQDSNKVVNTIEYVPEIYNYFAENDPQFLDLVVANNRDHIPEAILREWYHNENIDPDERRAQIDDFLERITKFISPSKLWRISTDIKSIEGMKEAYRNGANPASGRIKPYVVAIDDRDMELLQILLKEGEDPTVGFPRPGRKEYNYPIRRAAFKGWLDGFKALLADPRTDPSDHKNSALKGVQAEINNLTSNSDTFGRNWNIRDNEDEKNELLDQYREILKLLLADPRVQKDISLIGKAGMERLKDW